MTRTCFVEIAHNRIFVTSKEWLVDYRPDSNYTYLVKKAEIDIDTIRTLAAMCGIAFLYHGAIYEIYERENSDAGRFLMELLL